jgi:uncharacterized lipoprotein YajG
MTRLIRAIALLCALLIMSACARTGATDGLTPGDIAAQQAIDDGELRPLATGDFED